MSRSWFEGVHYDGLTMPAGSAEDRVLDSLEPEPENPPSRREVDDSDDELPLKRRKIGDIETVTFGDLVDFVAGLASQQPTERLSKYSKTSRHSVTG
ncbi:hypothetical protein PHISCL_08629 [Aspergillus sclerotialis]|uniref:Uncharacterized protein n=1 Tax=Aspergillus sclerotialis TaxID=2070753 RepID=A0A3A2ZPK8_9EURO|nr:hypothetical protein PHISCL_08629 [Aspergillus sclerotialis]